LVYVVLGIGLVVVALVVGFAYLWTSALSSSSMCANGVVHEEPSPDGKRRAVIFERDCGATTRESTQVMILRNEVQLPNASGNAFVAYVDPALVQVSWVSADSLLLTRPELPQNSIFLQEPKVDEVSIAYAVRKCAV